MLVRRESLARFERLAAQWGDRAKPLVGDLTAADLGLTDETLAELGTVDHVVHCGAIYDITADDDAQRAANVDGTRAVIDLARGWTRRCTTCRRSRWRAPSPASTPRTTSTSRRTCRRRITRPSSRPSCWCARRPGLRYRVYRPAVVVGDSRTGEMDKVDGPYYFFGLLAKLAVLPRFTPMVLPDTGRTNIVPVDYVVDALVELMHARRPRRSDVPPDRAEDRSGCAASTAASPRRPACRRCAARCPASTATPFLKATGRAKVAAQHGGHPTRHPGRDPRRRRPGPDVHLRQHRRSVARQRNHACPSSPPTRRSCGGTGPSTSTPTGPAATTPPGRWSVATSSSPAPPAASAAPRRSPSPNAGRRCSRWRATPTRSTTWSPRSANPAATHTHSRATSPIRRRWNTP